MTTYSIKCITQDTQYIEVEAESKEEAIEIAEGIDLADWRLTLSETIDMVVVDE